MWFTVIDETSKIPLMTKEDFISKIVTKPIPPSYRWYRRYCRLIEDYTGKRPYFSNWLPHDPRLKKFEEILNIAKEFEVEPDVLFELYIIQSLRTNRQIFPPSALSSEMAIGIMESSYRELTKEAEYSRTVEVSNDVHERFEINRLHQFRSVLDGLMQKKQVADWTQLFLLPSKSMSFMANFDKNNQIPDSFKVLSSDYQDWVFAKMPEKPVPITSRLRKTFNDLFPSP